MINPAPLEVLMPRRMLSDVVLSSGYLDTGLQATQLLTAATQRAMRKPGAWDHTSGGGDEDLRAWFASSIGGGRRAADVTIAPGGQAALSSAFRGLGSPGAAVIIESPAYPGAVLAAQAAGLRVIPWPVEPSPDPELLDDLIAASGARLIYAQSRFANPTGATWDDEVRVAIRDILHRRKAFLIDDDWASELTLEGVTPHSFAAEDPDGHVVTIRSLTKLMAPGMRIAAVSARGPAAQRLSSTRLLDDLAVSGLLQRAAVELVTSPQWTRHLRQLKLVLVERRDVLVEEVRAWLGSGSVDRPSGGLHLWVRLPDSINAEQLAANAIVAGVVVSPGGGWYPGEATGSRLRLSYSAATPEQIRAGVATLRKLS
jgi:DNA-binding transcriptional MocR family regulator